MNKTTLVGKVIIIIIMMMMMIFSLLLLPSFAFVVVVGGGDANKIASCGSLFKTIRNNKFRNAFQPKTRSLPPKKSTTRKNNGNIIQPFGIPTSIFLEVRGGGISNDDGDANDRNKSNRCESDSDDGSLQSFLRRVTPIVNYELPENTDCKRWIVIVDSFCPYHGEYLAQMAREVYGVGVIHALSTYVTGYLIQSSLHSNNNDGDDAVVTTQEETEKKIQELSSMRLPLALDEMKSWIQSFQRINNDENENDVSNNNSDDTHHHQILGIICESDSGLDDTERFSDILPNYKKNNGYNPARRDKFLMNQLVSNKQNGLRTVKQKLCYSEQEAVEFAVTQLGLSQQQLGTNSTDSATSTDKKLNDNNNDMYMETSFILEEDDTNNGVLGEDEYSAGLAFDDKNERKTKYCIVKPCRGVASDGVYLCSNVSELKDAFRKIKGSSIFGTVSSKDSSSNKHDAVLVQEFASGTEYAIDIVSKNGDHKVAALWRYDKRPVNGAPFVYHATELIDANTDVGRAICQYIMTSLDALDIKWGITHSEIIILDNNSDLKENLHDNIVLVEVNCRQHATDFAPLTSACIGYNALDMLLAAYLGENEEEEESALPPETKDARLNWDDLPDYPTTRSYGAIVHLVSHVEGTIVNINYDVLEEMNNHLPSVLAMEIYPQFTEIGNPIEKTIDIRSDTGWVHMMNHDRDQFSRDYDRIVELMPHMFEVE